MFRIYPNGNPLKDNMPTAAKPHYLLDTNVLIEAFLGVEPPASKVRQWIESSQISLSVISVAEYLSKASAPERHSLQQLLSVFGSLPVDQHIAEIAGDYRQKFSTKSKKVYLLDCLIAATAQKHGLVLVTRNTSDYPMTDIQVLDPHLNS
jgi:predicted nucleic acid-binding protein